MGGTVVSCQWKAENIYDFGGLESVFVLCVSVCVCVFAAFYKMKKNSTIDISFLEYTQSFYSFSCFVYIDIYLLGLHGIKE